MAKKRKTAQKKSSRKPASKTLNGSARQVYNFQKRAAENLSNFNTSDMEKIMNKSKTQMDQFANDAANSSRELSEAALKSASIFAKGMEEIMRTCMGLAQNAAEKHADFLKQAMGTKSLNELTEIQNKTAQKNYDEFVANATRLSELSVRTLTESAEPLNNQINKAVQKASQMAA